MKLLFMGTPEFAREQLKALWAHSEEYGWEIVGVLSQPDKPKGRGYKLIPTPVKEFALEKGMTVYQPDNLKDASFEALLRAIAPELIVVAAYGKILPKFVLEYPKYGCINVHGSLLPAYRGAAPIQRAIMDGCTETGITIMHMDEGLDTGDILSTCTVPIDPDDDFGTLYTKMGIAGAELLVKTIPELVMGRLQRKQQDNAIATYAGKIEKTECALDFTEPAQMLVNKIRGLSPAPLAFAYLKTDKDRRGIKFLCAEVETETEYPAGTAPGTVAAVDAKRNRFIVACGGETLMAVTALLPEGKGKMAAADFIRGRKVRVGDTLLKKE